MSTVALSHYNLPDVRQRANSPILERRHATDFPWRSLAPSSGSHRRISVLACPATGLSAWLDCILRPSEAERQSLTTPEVPAALAAIRDAFSLTTVQLAEVLGVSRQAIYDWVDSKPVKPENRRRLAQILEFSHEWKALNPRPMGPIACESLGGLSLIKLLRADPLESGKISGLLVCIAAKLAEGDAARPLSARELAEKHGMQPLPEEEHRRNLQTARLRLGRKG